MFVIVTSLLLELVLENDAVVLSASRYFVCTPTVVTIDASTAELNFNPPAMLSVIS